MRYWPCGGLAHVRQSRPDSGLGFRVKVLKTFLCVPSFYQACEVAQTAPWKIFDPRYCDQPLVRHVPYYLALKQSKKSETSTYFKSTLSISRNSWYKFTELSKSTQKLRSFRLSRSANSYGTCSTSSKIQHLKYARFSPQVEERGTKWGDTDRQASKGSTNRLFNFLDLYHQLSYSGERQYKPRS